MGEGDAVAAENAFRHALTLAPDLAEAHANLGLLLERRERRQEAENHYRRALELDPLQTQTYLNFGVLLTAQKRFVEAEIIYRYALAIDPESPAALSNLGVLLACVKQESEAEQCYRSALAIAPDYRKARFNLAYLLLRQGRYDEGWACLEARSSNTAFEKHLDFARWQGESLEGKSLLIGFEAGYGDMIHFCRYARLAKSRGAARISLLCHPALKKLFGSLRHADDVISFDEALPAIHWDYWTMPLSLPGLFQTRADTIPADLPYVFAESPRIARYANIVGTADKKLRVGLAWKGNALHENDADRSLPSSDTLAPLGAVPGVACFSLQKGAGEAESSAAPFPLMNLAPHIADFADTAAIVMNLDLVITVDTALAHLAGALGKPCWVLLPAYKADWRWLAKGDDTPWYPHVMRLFRQQIPGEWATVMNDVAAALRILATEGNAHA